jgi:DNA topoisomerase-2
LLHRLYKIFDEILVNAADNKQRDASMDALKVTIDAESNTISVYNNGAGLPVEIHAEEGVYVPELVFGHLLTSSNYDDSQKKTTGGRNGYGAKLTNIFSTEFVIESADGKRGRKYKQVSKKLHQFWRHALLSDGSAQVNPVKEQICRACLVLTTEDTI